jgi:hypothetical protein
MERRKDDLWYDYITCHEIFDLLTQLEISLGIYLCFFFLDGHFFAAMNNHDLFLVSTVKGLTGDI